MKIFKKIQIVTLFLLFSTSAFAQLGINTDGADPNSSAMLDVKSNDKGILIPRMTEMQKNEITVAAAQEGLMVYQTDGTKGFYYYNGSVWTLVGDGTADADANATNEAQTLSVSGGASPAISLSQVNSTGGGTVNLVAGTNVSLAQSGSNVTINSTSSGGGAGFTVNINGSASSTLGLTYVTSLNGDEHRFVSAQGYLVDIDGDDKLTPSTVYYSDADCTGTAVVSDTSHSRGDVFEIGNSGNLGFVPKDASRTSFTAVSSNSDSGGCAATTTNRIDDFIVNTTHNSGTTGITLTPNTIYIVTWN